MRYVDKRIAEMNASRQPVAESSDQADISPQADAEARRDYFRAYARLRRQTVSGRAEMMRSNLKGIHGISLEQYTERYERQQGRCAICRCDITQGYDPKRESTGKRGPPMNAAQIDHDHSCCPGRKSCGHCIRGLLCSSCNRGLQALRDNPALMRAAADYIERGR